MGELDVHVAAGLLRSRHRDLPWGVPARVLDQGRLLTETFERGALAGTDLARVPLTATHPRDAATLPIGVTVELEDRAEAAWGAWHVPLVQMPEQHWSPAVQSDVFARQVPVPASGGVEVPASVPPPPKVTGWHAKVSSLVGWHSVPAQQLSEPGVQTVPTGSQVTPWHWRSCRRRPSRRWLTPPAKDT